MDVSVCMATYNGEKFIKKQLVSILDELDQHDELVIVDDCSKDQTVQIIESFNDSRIKLYINNINHREVFSFNKAISFSKNRYIFLSDQDDIWIKGRVLKMKIKLKNSYLVSSNFTWIDELNQNIKIFHDGVSEKYSEKNFKNIYDIYIGKTNYYGCAMAFERSILDYAFPIPSNVESHDLWFALVGNILCKNIHINECTLLKRDHTNNTTNTISNRSIYKKLFSRIIFSLNIVTIIKRIFSMNLNKNRLFLKN